MSAKDLQLTIFSVLVGAISLASLLYIYISSPDYLRKSRHGTPFFTSPVIHPDSSTPISIDELIIHYKGEG